MKKIGSILLAFIMVFTSGVAGVSAQTTKSNKEMRAAWISTVYNIDWPSTKNNESKQKQEYINLLDKLQSTGINTVVVQVRPKSDAIYKSTINTWSEYLTGVQGKDPGYDPLPFLIEEAHKRGMEFHAWFNPYRITMADESLTKLPANHPAIKNPGWVVKHGNKYYYNPGLPEVKKYIVDSVMEVVNKYDIDGVHFDDYFYPGVSFDDADAYSKYGNGVNKDDWRRENVNDLLRQVKAAVKASKPNVVFGVSPAGIWRNKSASEPTGSDTNGNESYVGTYADTRAWIKQGLVDYVVPQLYWPIGLKAADYSKLVAWWANEVKGTNVDLYIGQGIYKQGQSSYGGQNIAKEIVQQVELNRKYPEIKGSMYFSAKDIINSTSLQNELKRLNPKHVILIGGENSIGSKVEGVIKNLGSDITIDRVGGSDRYETSLLISEKVAEKNDVNKVYVTSGIGEADSLSIASKAGAEKQPIVLASKDDISRGIYDWIKEKEVKDAYFIGGTASLSDKVISKVDSIVSSDVSKNRIAGSDRQETNAKVIEKFYPEQTYSSVYVSKSDQLVDALTAGPLAAKTNSPVVLLGNSVSTTQSTVLDAKKSELVYEIGGGINRTALIRLLNLIA